MPNSRANPAFFSPAVTRAAVVDARFLCECDAFALALARGEKKAGLAREFKISRETLYQYASAMR